MRKDIANRLWKSSEALWTVECDGWESLKPEIAIPAGILLLVIFLLVSGWAG